MKKIYFLAMLMAVSCWVSAQTFVSEDFSSGDMPPAGWTIDAHAVNWSAEASTNAGGVAPEAVFFYDPSFNAASRLISPAIDLTGYTSVKLMFKHFLDDYEGAGYSLGVATRSGGGTWNTAWSVNPTGDIGPEEIVVDITNADVGAADFQFCIYFSGNSYNLDYWYIDDILLFVPYDVDAALAKVTTPTYVGGPTPVEGIVRNLGNEVITSVEISWKVGDETTFVTTINGLNLNFSESADFSCNDLFHFPIGGYSLDVWVSGVNGGPDGNVDNDLKTKEINVFSHSIPRKPAFEEFTSSTCAPCAQFNTSFNPWTEDHAGDITLIKYQMNWPGNGDPYYTAEGGVRRNFYGVSYVPWPQCNGAYVDYSIGAVENAFQDAILQPGLAKIAASHTINGTEITVNANILPFANFEDFRAHIIVIENMTTGNVATNGETEFHHVMMKMMPDAEGTPLNTNDRETVTLTETVDLAGTNIEEFDDLSVVVLFQDYATKEIFQSEYSQDGQEYFDVSSCTAIYYDDVLIPGFAPDVYDYEIELPVGTTQVPLVTANPADPTEEVVIIPAWELPGTTVVDAFAENLVNRSTYNIHFTVAVGIGEPEAGNNIKLFPNPAKNMVYIQGAMNSDIRLYNITGQLVYAENGFEGNSIDISALENGIYTIQIILEDRSIVSKKITVIR